MTNLRYGQGMPFAVDRFDSMQHLIIRLEAPLMAFGGETIDNIGVIRRFPAVSMLTGLFANALGWRRSESARHQDLQDRIVFAARIDREPADGLHLTDFQTANLEKSDLGWTTRGTPEGRGGSPNTYDSPHLRFRDYLVDMRVTLALRLEPAGIQPTLEDLVTALNDPARAIFIGRKPCLPSGPIYSDLRDADSALRALIDAPFDAPNASLGQPVHLLWQNGESSDMVSVSSTYMLTDERNWRSGLHGGGRLVHEGTLAPECFGRREGK